MVRSLQKKKVIKSRDRILILLKFFIVLNLFTIPLYLIIYFDVPFFAFQNFIATIIYKLLNILGYEVNQTEYFLKVFYSEGILHLEISKDSTGWKSMYLLFALIMATPVSNLKNKIKTLSAGLTIIFFLNITRILTTIIIGLNFGLNYFDLVHNLLWREGLILAVILIWLFWLRNHLKVNKNIFILGTNVKKRGK